MRGLVFDIAHLLAGSLVLVSFMMLYQDRLYALLNIFALHAFVLSLSVAWQAFIQDAPHLYLTALIALVFKAIIIPVALHRIIVQLGIHREIETVVGVGITMLGGVGLVALSIMIMLRVTPEADPLAREDLAFALAVDPARAAADGDAAQRGQSGRRLHVARERPRAGGDRRQGHAAGGRDLDRVLDPDRVHRDRHLPVPHPRALRHGRRAGARPLPRRAPMMPFGLDRAHGGAGRFPQSRRRCSRCCPPIGSPRASTYWRRLLSFLAALSLFFERPPRRALSAGRRSQQRLHRADDVRRLHHQRVLGELYRPRAGDRPADADQSALLSRDVSDC